MRTLSTIGACLALASLCACAGLANYINPTTDAAAELVATDAGKVNADLLALNADRQVKPIDPAAIAADLSTLNTDQATLRTDFAALQADLKAKGAPPPPAPNVPMTGEGS